MIKSSRSVDRMGKQQQRWSALCRKVREELSLKDEWTLPGRQGGWTSFKLVVLTLAFFSLLSKALVDSSMVFRSKSRFLSLTFVAFHHLASDGLSTSASRQPKFCTMTFLLIPKQFLNTYISSLLMNPLPTTLSSLSWGTVLLVSVHTTWS